jgi:secreted trypsin-like serine protease
MSRSQSLLRSFVVVIAALAMVVQTVVPETGQAKPGHHRVGAQVVHGVDVADGQFPFVAAVGYADPSGAFLWDNMFCGGSLVAPDLVLTAAHCVLGTTPGELAVVVGRTVMTADQGQVRSVAETIMDPSFNHAEATNDLALFRLNLPVNVITPITVISAGDTTFNVPGTPLTLIGWGDTLPRPHGGKPDVFPDRLQQAQVNVVDDTTCAKQWRKTGFNNGSVWSIILCTTPGVFGSGDSGSPLFVATPGGYVQVALVSGSYSKHHKHKNKNKNKKKKKKLHQTIPDYGPELSAPSSVDFLAAYGV